MVLETGDHGTFNSWDRREWFFPCPDQEGDEEGTATAAATTTKLCFMPEWHKVSQNQFIGPAGWNMDHDDSSSRYHDFSNIVYQGGFKYRDGIDRNMTGNLMLGQAKPVFQVTGFETDYFTDNYLDMSGPLCGPSNLGALSGNTFITGYSSNNINGDENNKSGGSRNESVSVFSADPQKCDKGVQKAMTEAEVEALARKIVGL